MGDRFGNPIARPADPLQAISTAEPLAQSQTGEPRSIADAGASHRLGRKVAELLAGRWTLGVLAELTRGGLRYQDLHDALDGVSYKVLTDTLRRAERDGLIVRHLDSSRVETATLYELTDLGRSLDAPLETFYGILGDYFADRELFSQVQDEVLHIGAGVMATILKHAEERGEVQVEVSPKGGHAPYGPVSPRAVHPAQPAHQEGHHLDRGRRVPPACA